MFGMAFAIIACLMPSSPSGRRSATHSPSKRLDNRRQPAMSISQDSTIALLLAQHATETAHREAHKVVVTVTMSPNPSPRKGKTAKVVAPPTPTTRSLGVSLPATGTLDAAGFMRAIRIAGQRTTPEGKTYTDPGQVRGDTIRAIAGYVGYDPRGSFGSQDTAARALASRTLSGRVIGGMTRAEQRSAARSLEGYVAGMPNHRMAHLVSLQAQESHTAELIIDLKKLLPTLDGGDLLLATAEIAKLDALLANIKETLNAHTV
jgi:hypothetical protein